jgi:radical SAM superfamily enzyme YgiQ (UPF0313 family)
MNYDILLIFCPIFDVKEPPLGLAYIAENLSASGWRVCVRDLNLEFYLSNTDKHILWETSTSYNVSLLQTFQDYIAAAAQKIADSGIPAVGFSVNQFNLCVSVGLARRIKELNKKIVIVFGGPECFLKSDREHIPSDALDYFVVGDGEAIANNFLASFVKGNSLDDIGGIIPAGKDRELAYNPKVYPSHKDLLIPSFKHFRVGEYANNSLPIIFTRGCVRSCAFCSDQSYHWPFSFADPVKAVDSLQFYIEKYRINSFSFHDQAINGNLQGLNHFLEEIINRKMNIYWSSNIAVSRGMDHKFFNMMKAAGCQNLFFGIESFSDRVLRGMRKGFTAQDAVQALGLCSESGIGVFINLIMGFPGETEEDVDQTIHSLTENRKIINKVLNLSTCFVAPRTDLERRPLDYGIVLPNNHFSNWYTIDGLNTNSSRIVLVNRIKKVLDDLEIPIETVNTLKDDSVYVKLDDRLKRN